MKETQFQKVVNTFQTLHTDKHTGKTDWHCYGSLMAENEYASSLPRSAAKLREKVDTSYRDTEKGLIGVLDFEGNSYEWYEKMRGATKLFYLKKIAKRNSFASEETEQASLFESVLPSFISR